MDIHKFFAPVTTNLKTAENYNSSLPEQSVPAIVIDDKQKDTSSESRGEHEQDIPDEPYQPDVSCIPSQKLAKKNLKFQQRWFSNYHWLHFDSKTGGVLCHVCITAKRKKLSELTNCGEESFVARGFTNWKKAIEKFDAHEKSNSHRLSLENIKFHKTQQSVSAQISSGVLADQGQARVALVKLISTLMFVAEQGLPLRGKESSEGNYKKLLELRAEDVATLKSWLARKQNFTSGEIQNELLLIMSHTVLRELCKDVRTMSSLFGIIVDGTQDIQGIEQESICVRYVTDNFDVREDFLGLYNISSTTGQSISRMLVDALIRLQLPIEQLRAQTYDGATVQTAPFIKDALDHVHERGNLYDGSGKYKHLYLHLHDDDTEKGSPTRLKPICPTRWLTRASAVTTALHNYADVLDSLQEASAEFGTNTGSRANGIYTCLSSGKCILGLLASLPIINCLEALNKSLQGSGINVSGMLESVKVVSGELKKLRSIKKFSDIYQAAKAKIAELDLTPLAVPRQRKRHKRLQQGNAEAFNTDTAEQMYRIQFFTVIDTAITNLQDYFVSSDLAKYQELSALLLNGTTSNEDAIIQEYPELTESLKIELSFYRNHHPASTLEGHRLIFKAMEPSVRRMFPQVERLLRLLLVSPASSCEAERSFSALRRIKTWRRSTMTQKR
ncbi:zinc finger MYM-type protein 1-like [Gigantopelta aegis]|uniref:zinc finger MYM-type protein 1-like n=1 Tax=Gigantopelta aegis TaxID=1735272 RepID=UPI001B888A01|nr:zinc finger MYM-type protein 1-like [Gigantopelta aegis]